MVPRTTNVLVPTDFSDTADSALVYATMLAARLGASLHLLHVFSDPYMLPTYAPDVYSEVPAVLREEALQRVDEELGIRVATIVLSVPASKAVVTGPAAREIVRYAAAHGIDLIVMGTHGRRGVAHLLLGSVAEHVVRTAPCPVLTVRGSGGHQHPVSVADSARPVVA
jgi:nucleotide-binding universal stress UspA family protein